MSKFTRSNVEKLRDDLDKLLNEFNKTSDIKMELGNAKFSTEVTFKLTGRQIVNGELQPKESADFDTYKDIHGLKSHALNYTFTHNFKTIKIVGYKPRSPKYAIIYEQNGKPYKCTVAHMTNIIKISAQELLF